MQTFLGKGSHGTPGSEMKTSELLGSEIVKTNIENKSQISGLGANAQTTFLGGGGVAAIDISDTVRSHAASVPTPSVAAPLSEPGPPQPAPKKSVLYRRRAPRVGFGAGFPATIDRR